MEGKSLIGGNQVLCPFSSLPCAQEELSFLLFPSSSPAWGDRQRTKLPPLAILDLAEQRARGRISFLPAHYSLLWVVGRSKESGGEGCSVLVGHLWALPWSNFFLPFLGEAGTHPFKVSLGCCLSQPSRSEHGQPCLAGKPPTPASFSFLLCLTLSFLLTRDLMISLGIVSETMFLSCLVSQSWMLQTGLVKLD